MGLNWLLSSPTGSMSITGSGTTVTYSFKIVREKPSGSTMKALPMDGLVSAPNQVPPPPQVLERWSELAKSAVGGDSEVQVMTPGPA